MSYRDAEKKQIGAIRDTLFRDSGGGIFKKKPYSFVLKNARLNLWNGIREDAFTYFERNAIAWWGGEESGVTGHLLSSQVACLNHLFPLRQREDMATAVLRGIREDVISAVVVDDGFVEFEVVGEENYLGEKSHSRGANATSIDAVMIGKKKSGKNLLVLIEWKYTEEYGSNSLYIPARAKIYDPLLKQSDCPIEARDGSAFYYEPYYQLMRQTLLGWLMVKNGEYDCDEFVHIHVIPSENKKLRSTITSPNLAGNSMSDAWQKSLKNPDAYILTTPEDLMKPIINCTDSRSLTDYLRVRYWGD